MPLNILATIAADAAGAKIKDSSDKKKLDDAKDDPEEHQRLIEKIEKRKQRGNKISIYLIIFFFVYLVVVNVARNH
jgi:t-SNARE complex subunit (syntaxin)